MYKYIYTYVYICYHQKSRSLKNQPLCSYKLNTYWQFQQWWFASPKVPEFLGEYKSSYRNSISSTLLLFKIAMENHHSSEENISKSYINDTCSIAYVSSQRVRRFPEMGVPPVIIHFHRILSMK